MLHIILVTKFHNTTDTFSLYIIIIYSLPHVENVDSYDIKSNKTGQISDKNITISLIIFFSQ